MPELFNFTTNKQGLIVFGGEASSDYGIVVKEAPTFERPARKQTVFTVPGRNGAVVYQQDAWEDVTRQYKVFLTKEGKAPLHEAVDAFEAWLNSQKGYTRLEDSFEPEVFRMAYFSGNNSVTNEMTQYGESTLTFTCKPQRFYKDGDEALDCSGGRVLYNSTRFTAKPLIYIKVTAAAIITVNINGVGISADIPANDYIYIDCETRNAYRQSNENRNHKIAGNFPTLEPGSNTVTITGVTSAIDITPRYFTI